MPPLPAGRLDAEVLSAQPSSVAPAAPGHERFETTDSPYPRVARIEAISPPKGTHQ